MGGKQIRYSLNGRRRGIGRAAVMFASLTLALGVSGCGDGSDGSANGEKAADAEIVNGALERELTAVDAYAPALRLSRGQALAVARQLRGQNQAHVDALTKAMRGLGAPVEAEAAELEGGRRDRVAALDLAFEQENAALSYYLYAVRHAQTRAPRALSASLAASHAQHLVLLRQVLGAPLTAAAPEAFEPGNAPPPGQPTKAG